MWHRYDGKMTQHDELHLTVIANVTVHIITLNIDAFALGNACKALGWLCEEERFKDRPCLKVVYRTPFTLAMMAQAQHCASKNISYDDEYSHFLSMLEKQGIIITDAVSTWITCEFT